MAYAEQEEKKYVCVDEVIDRLYDNEFAMHCPLDEVSDVIYNTPTADVVEVKHGEWQRQNGGFFFLCSVCGKAAATKGNYCHSCGAKMDGGTE